MAVNVIWGIENQCLVGIVTFQVSLKVIETCVRLCTELTGKRSNPCVTHGVFFKFTATGESFPTLGAHIRALPGVNAHVKRHFARHGESSPTHGALVWLFSRVCASVYLQLAG